MDSAIVERYYQTRAIKAVGAAFDAGQREALLVMATVNLVTEKATDGRVYASAYPMIMNLINDVEGGQRRSGAGLLRLIVIDEATGSFTSRTAFPPTLRLADRILAGEVTPSAQSEPMSGWMVKVTDTRTILLLHGVQASQLTWWRLKQDLHDLGWQVHTIDLLGHGSRNAAGPRDLTVEDLARDVLSQVPGPVNVVAGHSLGSVVGLTAARLAPDYCNRVVVEDPPAISRTPMEHDVVANMEETIRATRADPAGTLPALLRENPAWTYRDAENSLQNRLNLDLERVVRFLRSTWWDVEDLVERCPVPVSLLAATQGSTLVEPARSALMSRLPAEHVAVVDSGHTIHRERPALWLHHFLRFAEAA